jgi:hypothetical protein
MKKDRLHARITGSFYLLAATTSVIALKLYEPVLFHPDFLHQAAQHNNQMITGALIELFTVITVAGTAIMLFPYLRKYHESLALAYLCFRFMEAILILIGILSILALLTLSRTQAPGGAVLIAIHDWTFLLGPNFMLGINTFLYSYIFYQTNLVPKKLALLGLAAASFIFLAALLELFGIIPQISLWGGLLAIPVFVYEMTLAIRLLTKGFHLNNH